MYETTVSVANENEYLLEYIKKQLTPSLREADGISTEINEKFYSFFSLACADTYRFQIRRELTDATARALTLGYKNIYARDLLNIDEGSFYQNVLVNTLCIFDNDFDRQAVSRLLDVDNPICLDGYFNFRMDAVKTKWREIIKLVSDNSYVLSDKKTIIEFLQYLLESTPSKVKKLSVSLDENGFVLYDTSEKVLEPVLSLAKCTSREEDVMLNVLFVKPQKVKIYHSDPLGCDFCSMLDSLFDTEYVEVH